MKAHAHSAKSENVKIHFQNTAKEIVYLALGVSLLTVSAWIGIPFGSVPVTLQTFAVALIGVLFGAVRGGLAVLIYFLMGLIGIPVFAGFNSGVVALLGPTGGYMIGFLFDIVIVGLFSRIQMQNRIVKTLLLYLGMLLALIVLYFFGTLWFITVYSGKNAVGVGTALALCVVPYCMPDALKVLFAAIIGISLKPHLKLNVKKQKSPQ